MGRGFLAGTFWGAIVGIGMLLVSSQALERRSLSLPQPEATAVQVPGGTEFDQAKVETEPVLPETDERPSADKTSLADAPDTAVDSAPSFDTSALEVPTPSVGTAGALSDAPETTNAPDAPAVSEETRPDDTGDALVVPDAPGAAPEAGDAAPERVTTPSSDQDTKPDAPESDAAPEETEMAALQDVGQETSAEPETGSAPTVSTDDSSPASLQAPAVGDAPSLPEVEATEESQTRLPWLEALEQPAQPASPDAAPEAPTLPGVADGGEANESNSFFEKVETLEDKADAVETDRLPVIGDDDGTDETDQIASNDTGSALPTVRRLGQDNSEVEPSGSETDQGASDVESQDGPALTQYANAFENPAGNPLISLILVHGGATELSATELAVLPGSVAFAVEAGATGARDVALDYRAAGREVVMIPSLPQGASPQDVEQALRVNFEAVPEAVAVMDVTGSSFQSDRDAVQQVVDIVAASGHGLITFPRGLNTAHQSAERAGVPAGLIFRRLDGAGETGEQIRRSLDRAAFRARADDAVILVGTMAPDTLSAIVEWAAGNRAKSVTLAPISAALKN